MYGCIEREDGASRGTNYVAHVNSYDVLVKASPNLCK